MVDTALDLFKGRQTAGRATVLVFYRGERSFFCKQWLRRWLSIPGFDRRLDLADVFLLFISSQSQGKAYSVADQIAGRKPILDTRVFFFGDPEHLLVDYLAESGLAHPVVTNPDSHRAHGWVFDYGMVQPAILAIAADGSVLYEWTSKPSLLNVAGKLDRPDPWDVWDKIEQRIDRIRITKARAARRAIAAGTSAVSTVKEGSTISSDPQSQPNTPEAYNSAAVPSRSALKGPNVSNPTQLSLNSLAISQQLPVTQPDSPILTESPEKEPKSAEEDREDETKSTLTPRDQPEEDSSTNDTFSPIGGERNLPKSGSDGEGAAAPPSTAIDTLTVDALKTPLSREERDSSEGDMSNIRVHQFSASISALASEVLADKNLSLTEPEPETVAKLPKLAEEVVLSQHQAECLTDEELECEGNDNDGGDHRGAPQDEPFEKIAVSTKDADREDVDAVKKVGQTTVLEVRRQADEHVVRFVEHVGTEAAAETLDDENEITGATEAVSPSPIVQHITMEEEDPQKNAETNGMDTNISDVVEVEAATSKEVAMSVSLDPLRMSERFDVQGSVGDTLETSVASLGSDQVDSTAIIVKHPSVRTEDSAQMNSLAGLEGSSFPSERRIPEEAEDKKTGISDYLKELKDPSKLNDPRYRSRYDPLPPMKPSGRRSTPSSSNSRPRPTSVSGYSYARDANVGTNVGLAQGLIQQETSMQPSEGSRRDSTRRGRETRVSQRTAPPVAVYVADTGPATPPHIASTTLHRRSPEPMTASPHPEIHNLTRTGTVDISPFVDADHELTMPEDLGTRSSLRDEYEAYDEYIVCEYEVEEYVEEYESDAFSRSKVFVTTVVDDSSQDSQSMRTASEGRTRNELHHFDHCNVVDVKGTARETDPEGRVRMWKESGGRPNAAVSPAVEENMTHRQAGSQTMSPVQVLLRKIGVKGVRRARTSEEAGSTEDVPQMLARDPSRISRKDTLRSVLRKTPRERVTAGELEETVEAEEEEAKLGRKETIKSVLRKIPVPKNLKRAQTEVAIGAHANEERGTTPVQDTGARSSKRGGLQAVLQRLPSLSSANRHRGGVRVETMSPVTSTNEIAETSDLQGGQEQVPQEEDRETTPMSEEVEVEKPGVFKRTFSRLAQTEEADTADRTEVGRTGATSRGSGALDERRKVRWGEDGEKVGGKMSFAVVGGRILSKFKM